MQNARRRSERKPFVPNSFFGAAEVNSKLRDGLPPLVIEKLPNSAPARLSSPEATGKSSPWNEYLPIKVNAPTVEESGLKVDSGEKSETFEATTTAEVGVCNPRARENCPQAPTSGEVIAQSTGIASVLEHADQAEGRRERILDLLCRFHVPVSGIALPFFANNLLACLRIAVADQSADETHLRPILDDIEWLATSNDVADACPVPKLREGNPTFGHCATYTPHYAAICQVILPAHGIPPDPNKNKALATLQAQLFLLLTGTPLAPEQVAAYEESVRHSQAQNRDNFSTDSLP